MQEMDNGWLDIATLRVLRSLFETRNTTRTSEQLNISQPAVSRALAKLRDALGDPIMVKGPGGMVLTDRAGEIRSRLDAAIASLDELLVRPAFNPGTASRVFRITTTDYGALAILPRLSHALSEAAPGIALEILPFSPDAFRQLGDGQTDLVLYSDDEVPLPLRSRKLYREGYASLARRDHPALGKPMDLESFLAWPHALVTVLGGRKGVVDDALAALGRQRAIALWLPYFATAATVIAHTDMILTVPGRAADELSRGGALGRFEPPLAIEGFDYRLLWHDRGHADLGHKWLRDLIFEVSSSAPRQAP
jgi:DNA-binding transcriptional LysR family regulator